MALYDELDGALSLYTGHMPPAGKYGTAMRKRVVPAECETGTTARFERPDGDWLDLAGAARGEITSEDPEYPTEHAFLPGGLGWRAANPGPQTLRLLFHEPPTVRRLWLRFDEPEQMRTQEFVLGGVAGEVTPREVVRQQWTFSPSGGTSEVEDYNVDLRDVSVLELLHVPDIGGGGARGSLAELRLA